MGIEKQIDVSPQVEVYRPRNPVRIVTATSLFDGHDVTIGVMRRILQGSGAEVVHLGHNRSVEEVVSAAIQEDAQGIAMSSYQGGHVESFKYMYDLLQQKNAGHIKIFGGGGGTIVPREKQELEEYGISRIFHPKDGRQLGLQGMINEIMRECDFMPLNGVSDFDYKKELNSLTPTDWLALARLITLVEAGCIELSEIPQYKQKIPVIGITGTGGAGKSSFIDEILQRYLEDFPQGAVAVISVDPTRRRTGGALLGDRIRINSLSTGGVYMRSLATRNSGTEISNALQGAINVCKAAGFDFVIAETAGIGQADEAIAQLVDRSVYVMTPEYGAASQLEKIAMLDTADIVVVNKYDRQGGPDSVREVQKALQRARGAFHTSPVQMPVYPAISCRFNDTGVNSAYAALLSELGSISGQQQAVRIQNRPVGEPSRDHLIPPKRSHYLTEAAEAVESYKQWVREQSDIAGELYALYRAIAHFVIVDKALFIPYEVVHIEQSPEHVKQLMIEYNQLLNKLDPKCVALLGEWDEIVSRYGREKNSYRVRGRTIEVDNFRESLSHTAIPRVALPQFSDWGELLRWRLLENLPGEFPYTAGVFPFKRTEDPTRMFAGEGGPWRTNKRFHLLTEYAPFKRLSTAFDSPTLYGENPSRRPDIWGKIGTSGVSIATVEDVEALYAGFDLTDPDTSVSMTINGPAPTMLAFYFNAAVRQEMRKYLKKNEKITISDEQCLQPHGGGYSFEQLKKLLTEAEYQKIVNATVMQLRGTVQADILKEDQAQNTCIFSTEFALRMMGDVEQWFIDHKVENFYSVSISGYHIAEAGANPITQLALTLANGLTYVEYYRARGMKVDDFAPNLSFFFSNGMDAEYAVIGRVARRIWAAVMRDMYGAHERSQKLKYHIQTSGRSLHELNMSFNDIRTAAQAYLALADNCNSLHTNSSDEAVTTPTKESVRRAVAIQLILSREFGLLYNENPHQGSFFVEQLTDWVEEAVLAEFRALSERGGVLGAMERMYQRNKIQEESMYYEQLKHSGQLPIIGVNTFIQQGSESINQEMQLSRASEEEKEDQLARLDDFHARHQAEASSVIFRLKQAVLSGENIFGELLLSAQTLSLGQITHALYEVGGQYRRNM